MQVQELMSRPAVTCHVNDALTVAAHLMWDHDIGAVPVVNDEGKLTGMLTDRDMCMAAYMQGNPLDAILVNSAMATHVISVGPDQTIGEAEQLMADHKIRRLPVIDVEGKPIGVLSLSDLATESDKPHTQIKYGHAEIAHMFAAICQARSAKEQVA